MQDPFEEGRGKPKPGVAAAGGRKCQISQELGFVSAVRCWERLDWHHHWVGITMALRLGRTPVHRGTGGHMRCSAALLLVPVLAGLPLALNPS